MCCFCFLTQISTGPLRLCVGGPAYVHTCVLSGSRGTAGVLAFSENTIFKPFYISLSNLRSTVSRCQAQAHFLHVFLLLLLPIVCCSSHMNNIQEGNNRNWQDYLLTSTSLLRPPHLYRWKKRAESSFRRPPALNAHAHAGKTCALLVSDRRIKKNNDPASWHFELWISFILVNKHQPLCQAVKLL